jgi:hypothetical protein
MSRSVYRLHSALAPDALLEALRQNTDEERWSFFSMSRCRGDRDFIARAGADSMRVQKRRHWRNDFGPVFYARFERYPGGTLIEGSFDIPEWAKYFMRVWLVLAALIGAPVFVGSVAGVIAHAGVVRGNPWVGVLVPPFLIVWGFVLPGIGRLMSRREQRYILDFLQTTLAAHLEETAAIPAVAVKD